MYFNITYLNHKQTDGVRNCMNKVWFIPRSQTTGVLLWNFFC